MEIRPAKFKQQSTIDTIPGDKSISHRAIILGSLSTNKSIFNNFLCSEDCLNTASIFKQLGVSIEVDLASQIVTVEGVGLHGLKPSQSVLDAGNAGTGIRLVTGVLVAQEFDSRITGDASIQKRPMRRIVDPLNIMNADITGTVHKDDPELYPPLLISPVEKISAISYTLPVASAQVKSAILLAGLYADGNTTVKEKTPSRNHTETMLKYFGASISNENNTITLAGPAKLENPNPESPLIIPSDFSSAAYFIVLALLLPDTSWILKNISLNPTRAALLDVLKDMGANIQILNKKTDCLEPIGDIQVSSSKLHNIPLNPDIIPSLIDEIPILAIAAMFAEGECVLTGAKELRFKESDRIQTIQDMVKAMGGSIQTTEDGFRLSKTTTFNPTFTIKPQHDHRIAMSGIIGAYAAGVSASIEETDCIQTSFPSFFDILQSLKN